MKWTWAVRRGRVWTRFAHASAAWEYWRAVGGSVMFRDGERWRVAI